MLFTNENIKKKKIGQEKYNNNFHVIHHLIMALEKNQAS